MDSKHWPPQPHTQPQSQSQQQRQSQPSLTPLPTTDLFSGRDEQLEPVGPFEPTPSQAHTHAHTYAHASAFPPSTTSHQGQGQDALWPQLASRSRSFDPGSASSAELAHLLGRMSLPASDAHAAYEAAQIRSSLSSSTIAAAHAVGYSDRTSPLPRPYHPSSHPNLKPTTTTTTAHGPSAVPGPIQRPPWPGPGPIPNRLKQDPNEEITTVFIAGFPEDITEREFGNYFVFARGFEASSLKFPSDEPTSLPGGPPAAGTAKRQEQIIGFAKFRTRGEAMQARDWLNGRLVDPERGCVLKTEMAKKNLHMKSVRSGSSSSNLPSSGTQRPSAPGSYPADRRPVPSGLPNLGMPRPLSPLTPPHMGLAWGSMGEAGALAGGANATNSMMPPLTSAHGLSPISLSPLSPGPVSPPHALSRGPSPSFVEGIGSPALLSPRYDGPDPLSGRPPMDTLKSELKG